MPSIFRKIGRAKPTYDMTYQAVMLLYKAFLVVGTSITSMMVAGRYIPFTPGPAWNEEMVPTCMSYMAVPSTAPMIRRGAHIHVIAFDQYLPEKVMKSLDIITDLTVLALALIMITVGWKYTMGIDSKGTYVSMPKFSCFQIYLPVPSADVAILVFKTEALYNHAKGFLIKEGTG